MSSCSFVLIVLVLCWRYQLRRCLPSLHYDETRQNVTCGAQRAKKHILKEAVTCCFLPEHVTRFSAIIHQLVASSRGSRDLSPDGPGWVNRPFMCRVITDGAAPEVKCDWRARISESRICILWLCATEVLPRLTRMIDSCCSWARFTPS